MPTSSIRFISGTSSLGVLLLAFSAEGLCALLIGDDLVMLERDLSDGSLGGYCWGLERKRQLLDREAQR
ncbi:hypothetical protein ACQ4OB_02230 [Pseudomonas sp. ES4]|jgi:hypothetical protein|uniref:hypothetical protein n=1 Tax=Pseudomonas sp. ES4 TaxID=3424777 RepID=UPI003D33FF41